MLSIENPASADPYPCQVKKKNSVGYDEKKLKNLLDLDPSLSSSLDHPHNHNSNQIPNFSIRNYVFTSRSKDIKKNWPFSVENLQRCFRHGIKDPLPPFQALDYVKNQCFKPCTIQTVSRVEGKQIDQKLDDAQTNQKIIDQMRKCKPGTENELLSASTSVYQSEIESHEANQSVLKPTAVKPPLKSKSETTNKQTSKKIRLVSKIGSVPSEHIASSSAAVSELMASSKTCPVCKIFLSSSNTTLNAHIDQCLSGDSRSQKALGTKLIRHKIKPRKIRLMTDIYVTAKSCTLEELDRRNGTSWASFSSSLPAVEMDKADLLDEGENQRVLPVCSNEVATDVRPVFIDASGTKVRILSKFDDAAKISKAGKDFCPNKSLKGDKGGKFFLTKKKSCHGKKRHKYLKLVPQSGKLFFHKANASQVSASFEGYSREGNHKKDGSQISKLHGSSKQWVPSKCTALTKELTKRGCKSYPAVENDESCLGDSFLRRYCGQKLKSSSENEVGNMEMPLLPMKRNIVHLGKVSRFSRKSPIVRPHEKNRIKSCPDVKFSEVSPRTSSNKPIIQNSQERVKILSLAKKVSTRHQSERLFSINKTWPCLMDEEHEELVAPQPGMDQDCDSIDESNDNLRESEMITREETSASKSSLMVSQHHQQVNVESTKSSFRTDSDDDDDDADHEDDGVGDDDVIEDFESPKPTETRATNLSNFLNFEFRRLGAHPETISDSPQSVGHDKWIPGGPEARMPSGEPSFVSGQDMYSAHEDDNGISGDSGQGGAEFGKEVGQVSSFLEVEPIPIPGPPGSFLPSPRDMGSDDFQGNSSLTSLVQSCEDHRDFIDRNSSDSPVSIASTISNSMTGKSDQAKYTEQFSEVGMISVIEKSTSSFPRTDVECAEDSLAASYQQKCIGDERYPEGEKYGIGKLSFEKKPFGFRNDYQPCCCQRKEKTSRGFIALNHQEPQLHKQRTMASAETQLGIINPNMKLNNSDPRPDTAAMTNFKVSGSENVNMVAVRKLAAELSLSKESSTVDQVSSGRSASSPILRLMGKNLTVVNTEADASIPLNHAGLISKTNNPTPQISATPVFYPPCSDVIAFHLMASQRSVVFGQNPWNGPSMFDARCHFGNNINLMVAETQTQPMFQSHSMSCFSSSRPPDSSAPGEAPVIQSADFSAISLRQGSDSPVRLGCTPEGSRMIHQASAQYFS